MSRHQLTYIDLHPEPVRQDPPDWLIIVGAVLALLALYVITVFLFTL
jgi:hypothetical protein